MGWRPITLPDNLVYFYHPTLRVTTDTDLRIPNKLDAVTSYLQENSIDESFLPPEGWESWLVDSNVGKKHGLKPISSWVNHAEKILTFASPVPQSREVSTAKTLDDDRTFASCFACVTEYSIQHRSRPRIPTGLSWSLTLLMRPFPHRTLRRFRCLNLVVYRSVLVYTISAFWVRLNAPRPSPPSTRPVPPPFSQDECQELIKLLETLGKFPPLNTALALTPTHRPPKSS